MNFDQNIYSKESIKARMLQNAAKLWGVKSPQSLDPFVKLLIDAFSTEVFKANNEIQNVNARVLEKLAKLLTPSKYTHPNPAHAIALYLPNEETEIIPDYEEFFFKKSMNSFQKTQSDKQLEIPFTPVDNVKTVKAQTSIMFAGNVCYTFDETLNKTPLCRIKSRIEDYRRITIGINVSQHKGENFPKQLNLYCSNPAFAHIDYIFRLLPHIKVFSNGNPLTINSGINYETKEPTSGFEEIFREQSIKHKIVDDIKKIYNHKFIIVEDLSDNLLLEKGTFPQELKHLKGEYPQLENVIAENKFLWLTFEFPPQFTEEILDNFTFALNAFPVYNRAWKKTEYVLDIMGNNIPLETDDAEHFLYVEEVVDGRGKKYEEIPFTPNDDLRKGLYTVRKGGMERFTKRNAVDLMASVLELTRDEVAAFSVLNRDKVKDILGELSDKMKGMIKKIENTNREVKEDVNYVIIEPLGDTVHTYAAFWVTHCQLGNNIRSGTLLSSQAKAQNIVLLTETTGGEMEQKATNSIQAYKYALMTRDKIVSVDDVKAYCKMILKEELKNVKVTKGTMISDKPKEGFIRTVEVNIVPQNYSFYGKNYWENMATILKNNIKAKAIDGVEYFVTIHNEEMVS